MILVNRVSNLVHGHVLDCNVKSVESALKFYDPLLYLKWNPKKLKGEGCWEIRRKPAEQKIIETVTVEGISIHVLGYKEYDWVHHVKDYAYVNYSMLDWLQANDSFKNEYAQRNGLLAKQLEDNLDTTIYNEAAKADEEQAYIAKQTRGEWRKVMNDLNSGNSLASSLAKRGF